PPATQLPNSFGVHGKLLHTYDEHQVIFARLGPLPKASTNPELDAPRAQSVGKHQAAARVALVGFGTVGRAVGRILCESNDPSLRLTYICNRNVERKKQPWVSPDVVWTEDFQAILNSDADIVIELIGGLNPAEQIGRGA